MIKLGNASIHYAVMKCKERPHYKIIIAVSKMSRLREVYEAAMNVIEELDFDRPTSTMSRNQFSMLFDNGSSIKCIPASDNARGHAAHLVIDDYEIDDDIRNNVLRVIEKIKE